jgi:predicted transcriptional regulator
MKSVMLSIRPKWCEKIASGEKTIEVRKTKPKLETPFKCYIYCTSGRPDLNIPISPERLMQDYLDTGSMQSLNCPLGNGKVIGEFTCDRIYELAPLNHAPDDIEKQACLTREEIVNYLKGTGYGWHISDLLIYDQPRELPAFRRLCPNDLYCEACAMYSNNNGICNNGALTLRRPPQSWCYVEESKQKELEEM